MSRIGRIVVVATLAVWIAQPIGAGGDDSTRTPRDAGAKPAAAVASQSVVYRPPVRGRPRARVGGGVRGLSSNAPDVRALVPDHAGRTAWGRPVLLWYLGAPLPDDTSVLFTLRAEDGIDPILEVVLPAPTHTGIQRIDLAKRGVELSTDVEYVWTLSLVGASQGVDHVSSGGWIERVPLPASSAAPGDVRDLAASGLWYDAIAAAEDAVRADPSDDGARGVLASLLEQVGLKFD